MTSLRRATDARYPGLVGRGFSERNLEQTGKFYLGWQIPQTLSAETGPFPGIPQILSATHPAWAGFPPADAHE